MKAYSFTRRALLRGAVAATAVAMIGFAAAEAMRVSPMVVEMETRGTNAVARIEVQNLNQDKLAFETRVTRITYNEHGVSSETPADADFLIFPPQGVLPPGGRQVIRLQWVGAPDIPASQSYYVAVNQLPVALAPGQPGANGAQVQLVYHMKALVVVAPPGAQPNVSVVSAIAKDFQPPAPPTGGPLPPKVPGVEITMHNAGRRHAMMANIRWLLEGKDLKGNAQRIVITPDQLSETVGTGYIAPLTGTRVFDLPMAHPFGPGPITVRFLQ